MAKEKVGQEGHHSGAAVGIFGSAILLALAFIPETYGITVWFALVPALVVVRGLTMKKLFWLSWPAGYLHCLIAYYWVKIVSVSGGLALPIYLGIYWPLFFVGVEFLARRFAVPRVLAAIALWPALEFVRGALFTGLPWFYLGHALYRWPLLIQSADLGGVLFVSAVVAGVNALLAEVFVSRGQARRRVLYAGAAIILFAANLAYGGWRFANVELSPGPTVACVQPNVPQSIKISQSDKEAADIFARLRAGTIGPLARSADVVFWPETMMPGLVGVDDVTVANGMLAQPAKLLDELALQGVLTREKRSEALGLAQSGLDLVTAIERVCGKDVTKNLNTYGLLAATARIAGKPLVAGAIWAKVDKDDNVTETLNRVYQFGADGREIAYYDKVHLVPWGEFIPFRDSCPPLAEVLKRMMPVAPVVYPGADFKVLRVGSFNYGPAICFEDTFSYIGRRYRRLGADILVNVTNDGWFGGSFELEAHLGNAVFRAVETRMAVVRAANTGISAVISPRGEITARLRDLEGNDREVKGVLVAAAPVCRQRTLYTVAGDAWLIVPIALIAVTGLARTRRAA